MYIIFLKEYTYMTHRHHYYLKRNTKGYFLIVMVKTLNEKKVIVDLWVWALKAE